MDVTITQLVKEYGSVRALDGISLKIGQGMFGFLGPNGAGKTTLMKILTTLLLPSSGQVTIDGHDIVRDPQFVRQHLGYVPQEFGFYKSLNAYELLDYIATMKNIPRQQRRKQVESLLEQVNLTPDAKRRVGGYSGGMKRRLGIAQALLGDPSLLVVDEPTAGLDPEERIRFRNLLARISGQRTVILSTHIVSDIEASCTAVAVLNKGKLIFDNTPDQLVNQARNQVWEVAIDPMQYEEYENRYRVVNSRTMEGRMHLRIVSETAPSAEAHPATPTLEDGYIAVMQGAAASLEAVAHV